MEKVMQGLIILKPYNLFSVHMLWKVIDKKANHIIMSNVQIICSLLFDVASCYCVLPAFAFSLQAEDLKMNYIHGDSISSEMCLNPTSSAAVAKSSSSHSLEENDQCRCDPNEGNRMSVKNEGNAGLRPTVSPSDLHEADSYLPFKTNEFIKEQSQLHAVMKKKRYGTDLILQPELQLFLITFCFKGWSRIWDNKYFYQSKITVFNHRYLT